VRRVVGAVFARPAYHWVERRQPLSWLWQLIRRFFDWFGELSDKHPVGSTVVFAGATVLLVLLLVHIGYTLWPMLRSSKRGDARSGDGGGPIYDAARYAARAAELARAGRYAEALAHRFLAVVLELDRVDALRFHASKTPAEYMHEAHLDATGRASFAQLVGRLYRHLFGAVPCGEADYAAFGASAEELTRHVVPA
jgi:hypothetical protein